MLLNDELIIKYCQQGMVSPFDPKLVGACSLDIRIGYTAKLRVKGKFTFKELLNWKNWGKKKPSYWKDICLSDYSKKNPYMLEPGEKILIASLETFNIPEELAALIFLTSSRARELFEHLHATFVDAGYYQSVLTYEIKNEDYDPKKIYPGLIIGQLAFMQLVKTPEKSYLERGNYNFAELVESSKKEEETT